MPGAPRSWKRQEAPSPGASGGSLAAWTPWFQTSGLQNRESINFYCFKPPILWSFVTSIPRKLTRSPTGVSWALLSNNNLFRVIVSGCVSVGTQTKKACTNFFSRYLCQPISVCIFHSLSFYPKALPGFSTFRKQVASSYLDDLKAQALWDLRLRNALSCCCGNNTRARTWHSRNIFIPPASQCSLGRHLSFNRLSVILSYLGM